MPACSKEVKKIIMLENKGKLMGDKVQRSNTFANNQQDTKGKLIIYS